MRAWDVVESGKSVAGGLTRPVGRVRDKDRTARKSGKSGSGLRDRLWAAFEHTPADGGRAFDGVQLRRLGILRTKQIQVVHRGDEALHLGWFGAGAARFAESRG